MSHCFCIHIFTIKSDVRKYILRVLMFFLMLLLLGDCHISHPSCPLCPPPQYLCGSPSPVCQSVSHRISSVIVFGGLSHFNIGDSGPNLVQMLLYTIPASWLWCSVYFPDSNYSLHLAVTGFWFLRDPHSTLSPEAILMMYLLILSISSWIITLVSLL